MAEYMKKASKNLQASQELQKHWHDQKAVLIQYQPGQKVWVLEPVARRALQDKWSGPHLIVEMKGEVTYLVDLGTARSPLRVIHVNRLNPYYDRADLTLLMATDEGQEEESDPLPDLFSSTKEDALVEGVVLADCVLSSQRAVLWQKVKREMQRNSDELLHSLSEEFPKAETLNSQKRRFGYLGRRIGYQERCNTHRGRLRRRSCSWCMRRYTSIGKKCRSGSMALWFFLEFREVSRFPSVFCFRCAFDGVDTAPKQLADRRVVML
ncbi:hypothetical protein NDU88_006661 [Pleurodeles waltl]|uniref:Uncharacterized protein n=1 Tax=Pleurodeles waltl TaxID=8319 RepID=A0AAV7NQU3_PLEWA|nr:hypothetical protein NDU88_006661 [Pleurodeles waltl]